MYYPGCHLEQDRSSHPRPLSCQSRPWLSWFAMPVSVWLLALKCIRFFVYPCLCRSVLWGLWCWLVLLGQPLAVTLPVCCPPACLSIDAWYFAFCHSGYIFSFFCGSWPGCRLICWMQYLRVQITLWIFHSTRVQSKACWTQQQATADFNGTLNHVLNYWCYRVHHRV